MGLYGAFASDETVAFLKQQNNNNPFRIPTDEEVFTLRDALRRKRKEFKKKFAEMHVYEKPTFNTRLQVKKVQQEPQQSVDVPPQQQQQNEAPHLMKLTFPPIHSSNINNNSSGGGSDNKENGKPVTTRENKSKFIGRKRKMFLITMSMESKRQEIKKLELRAEERERLLTAEELLLRRDTARFDHFLTNNDIQAAQAINKAEEETRAKLSTHQQIKKLEIKRNEITSEIQRLKDQLNKCQEYKTFLDNLTPTSWFEEQWERRRNSRINSGRQSSRSSKSSIRANSTKQGENVEEAIQSEDMDDHEMYFTNPDQLEAQFTSLEEENLQLIQKDQEIEEKLAELIKQEKENTERMRQHSEEMSRQIKELNKQIQDEIDQRESWANRQKMLANNEVTAKIKALEKGIYELYKAFCENTAADIELDSIYMLAQIEQKVNNILADLEPLAPDFMARLERQRDKERRKNNMLLKAQSILEKKEETNRTRYAERSTSPVKRIGRPLMHRMRPLDDVKRSNENKKVEKLSDEQRDVFSGLFSE